MVATETRTVGKLCVVRALIKAVRLREILALFRISHTCVPISKTIGRDIRTNLRPVTRYIPFTGVFLERTHICSQGQSENNLSLSSQCEFSVSGRELRDC